MRKTLKTLAVTLILALPVSAQAAIINLGVNLTPGEEVLQPVISEGHGDGFINFETVTNTLSWLINYKDLTGPATAAHFHKGAPGVAGPALISLFATPGTTHLPFGNAGMMFGSTNITDAQETDLLGGLWYVNVHTSAYPGGEIRDQVGAATVNPVPVPAAAWLLLSGATGLAALRRRNDN